MKIYKLLDFLAQVIMIGATLFSALFDLELVVYGYFAVGGWQVLSCVIHEMLKDRFIVSKQRKYYSTTLIWVLAIGILSLPVWIIYGFVLLIVSPFLAVWYSSICYEENKMLEHKSMIHLK